MTPIEVKVLTSLRS